MPHKKQENDSERFNFIVSTLNVVNPKFVQPIDFAGIKWWQTKQSLDWYLILVSSLRSRHDLNISKIFNTRSKSMFKNNIDRHKFQHSKSYGPFSEAKTLSANLKSTDQIP